MWPVKNKKPALFFDKAGGSCEYHINQKEINRI